MAHISDTAPAYHARITHYDGSVSTRDYTAAEADALIDCDLCDGNTVIPAGDRSGRITITRACTGPRSATDSTPVKATMTIELEPAHAPRLTERQYKDLVIVRDHEERTYGAKLSAAGRIDAGFASIPPSSACRLFARGWLLLTPLEENGRPVPCVSVSYAGRIAMVLHEHRTTTTEGREECIDADGRERLSGWISKAWCSCRQWSTSVAGDRNAVRWAARRHRQEHLRPVFDSDV
jgi:hypothetical protein